MRERSHALLAALSLRATLTAARRAAVTVAHCEEHA